jgi:ADP-ribose pyrophosphatase YjhB (NUDIX family)
MTDAELQTLTAFIVRRREVLLLRHRFTGIQFPTGLVEAGETPEAAALRVVADQTGLDGIGWAAPAGATVEEVVGAGWLVAQTTPVFFRPDARSSSWAILRRGVSVTSEREDGEFVQVTYEEVDRAPSPQFLTARITGWVAREALAKERRRHFFVLPFEGEAPPAWAVSDGRDDCALFWAGVDCLPALAPPQDQWIPYLAAATGGAPLLSAMMGPRAAA